MIASVVAIALIAQKPETKLYEHTPSNIKFTLAGISKLVKKRGDWTITFPAGSGSATLQIYSISFTADPEVWEGSQKYFVEQQRLTMISMGREEILGVPLLLAKTQETATLDRKITLSGIVYAATDWKFSFRLTSPEATFAEAEAKWREAMQSFATIDGRLPEPEKPGRATEASAGNKKPPQVPDLTRTTIGNPGTTELPPIIGPSQIECSAAGKKLSLSAPAEWKWKGQTDTFVASHELSGVVVEIRVASTLDSPTMAASLDAESVKSLSEFTVVTRRTDTPANVNQAKSKVICISRDGQGSTGPLFVMLAGGEKGEYYWILRWTSKQKPTDAQAVALKSLLGGLSVEVAN